MNQTKMEKQKKIAKGQTKTAQQTENTKPIRQGDVLDQARLRPLITVRYKRLQGLICAV